MCYTLAMQSIGISLSAWREICARIFENFSRQDNVSPAWLVNPATNRRLKLDAYYPDAGFAIRFVGLTAKGQRRQSDWEAQEEEQRDQTRTELCRQHGVQLLLIDPLEEPVKLMDNLARLLLRAFRTIDQSNHPEEKRQMLLNRIDAARIQAGELRALIQRQPEQMMTNLASSWRDRENGFYSPAEPPPAPQRKDAPPLHLQEGQRVLHARFGEGVVTACLPQDNDIMVTILFDGDQARTFLASLLQDKLQILA